MNFSGQIEDFAPADIMQYVHTSKKTGVLNFQREKQLLRIFFKNGQIIRATKPGMTNIGDILFKLGRIDYSVLTKAIKIQQESHDKKRFGQVLKEMQVITQNEVREALLYQIKEVIEDLLSWTEGDFFLEIADVSADDDILIAFEDVLLSDKINTQSILLEAAKVFDEKKCREKSESKNKAEVEELKEFEEADVIMPEEVSNITSEECLQLKNTLSMIKEMLLERRDGGSSFSVSNSMLDIVSNYWNRSVLFLIRDDDILGLGAMIKEGDNWTFCDDIKGLKIPLEKDSFLRHCIKGKSAFIGAPPPQDWIRSITSKIGETDKSEILILPISGVERDVCIIYADSSGGSNNKQIIDILEVAAGQAGIILENQLLRKQLQSALKNTV